MGVGYLRFRMCIENMHAEIKGMNFMEGCYPSSVMNIEVCTDHGVV